MSNAAFDYEHERLWQLSLEVRTLNAVFVDIRAALLPYPEANSLLLKIRTILRPDGKVDTQFYVKSAEAREQLRKIFREQLNAPFSAPPLSETQLNGHRIVLY